MPRRLALGGVVVAVAAAAALALPAPPALAAANCLPDGTPLWIDYANPSVQFRDDLFKRPGLILAMEDVPTKRGGDPAGAFRSAGAVTVYWDEHMEKIVGTPSSPADPAEVAPEAADLAATARQSSGCQQPIIALNELLPPGGASSASVAQYRANVLALLQGLVNDSARPVLLLPSSTPTANAAGVFLAQAAGLSDLVAEVYFNNNRLFGSGPLLASRAIRIGLRQRIAALEALGIPAADLGVMLGFQSALGQGGREGLQPTASWLEMVKLQALAARQVASDTGLRTIWSWGWGTFANQGSADPDKETAACVYLWTRDPTLCDAPARVQFDTDLAEGQIDLPFGVQCGWDGGRITLVDFRRLTRALGGDQAKALTALLERGVVKTVARVRSRDISAAERAIVTKAFKGSGRRYRQALRAAKLGRLTARKIISDQLAQQAATAKVKPQTYPAWLAAQETAALATATCLLDQLPAAGHVDLVTSFPFLRVAAAKPKPTSARRGR
jgi:hypothetical protein